MSTTREWRGGWLSFALAAWLAGVGNIKLWMSAGQGPDGLSLPGLFALFLVVLAVFNGLLACLSWRPLLKPLGVLLLLLSAVVSLFMLDYGVLIDEGMIRNVAQTDAAEAGEFLTLRGAGLVALLGVLPAVVLATRRVRRETWRPALALRLRLVLLTAACAALAAWPAYREVSIVVRREQQLKMMLNPTYPLSALAGYLRGETRVEVERVEPLAPDARLRAPPGSDGRRRRVVVFVLGETASAAHFSLNGYARDTNPQLAARDVLNFPDVSSCGTATADSVPCLFSNLGREGFSRDRAQGSEGLLDVLARVGVDVLWRDNNTGSKGVADRVAYEDVAGPPEFFDGEGWYDEALLVGLEERLGRGDGDQFIVLHQRGSHGPAYSRRTPPAFKRFLPECARVDVQNCPREELVNAYDNTILYTDHVLARLIDLLAGASGTADVAMLYVSDHGESLGEDGIYLHGFPYWLAPKEQTHVPMVFWAGPDFWAGLGVRAELLPALARRALSHDHVFHTVLGLFGVETSVYDAGRDVFAPAR